MSGLVSALLGPTLPSLAQHTQTGLSEISFLFVGRALGTVAGSWLGGQLFDRFRGHRLMFTLLLSLGAVLAVVPSLTQLWLLTAMLLAMELARGVLSVGSNTMMIWLHGRRAAPLLNGLHLFHSVGAFLAPVVIAQLLRRGSDVTAGYWLLALLAAPLAFWFLSLASPSRPLPAPGEPAAAANRRLVGLVTLIFFLQGGAEISFGSWIFAYATAYALPPETAAYATSAFWGGLAVGRLVGIPMAARVRPRWMLLGGLTGCLVSVAGLLIGAGSPVTVWLGTISLGLSTATVLPTTLAMAMRRMPVTGRVIGWFFVGGSAGSILLPWLIGQAFEPIGPQALPWLLMGNLLVSFSAAVVLITRFSRIEGAPGPAATAA